MSTRLPSLHSSIETLAHDGASASAPPASRDSFELAAAMGIDGFDCTAWVTADGVAVVSGAGTIGSRFRRKPISSLRVAELPPEVMPLHELLDQHPDRTVSLDLPDDATFVAVNAVVSARGDDRARRLWFCSSRLDSLMAWREATPARLVSAVRLGGLDRSPEQWMALLAQRSIDGVRLDHVEWHSGLITLAHRFGRYALARGPVHEREMAAVIDIGIDALSTRHPDRLAAVAALYYPGRPDPSGASG